MKSAKNKLLNGTVKRHPDGFGFFIPDETEHADVYIPQQAMKSAMTNDKVAITFEKERDGRFRGEIIHILERSQKRIAGHFKVINEKYGLIKDEGRGWGSDLKIPLDLSKNAKSGELVEAKINQYPDEGEFHGEIVQVIGDSADPLNDIKRVVITQNIPEHFTPETLEEAKKFTSNPTEKDFVGRQDLRKLPIITIDGSTAKDFDDAVYTEMTDKGFHCYVAIADVSHYVQPQTAMDKDAYERGNSVYFPNFVIPMLPEALSNGLCSLNPHVPRLALVAEMNFDFTGVMTSSKFFEGVIESQARVTYGEAQEFIDNQQNPNFATSPLGKKLNHVKENILRCADLAKVLMARRFQEGSLDLEVPETELVIDGAGEPVDIIKSERLFAHRLIEEMMLAANVAVAKFFHQKEIPAIYRIHEPPDNLKIQLLERFLSNMGSRSTLSGGKLQKKMTKALHDFKGKPEEQIIHILTLRSMSQAKYSAQNVGHFGLGFEFYTHFTSPIRRYPDLIVHRLLKNLILQNSRYRAIPEDDLSSAGTWLSATEQKSAKAERQIQAIKKARFMKKMEGETFEGLISSVTKFGVFVLLRQFNIDGLIRLDDLGFEKWEFDEENLTLSAKRSGLMYKMGDVLKVTVSLADIESGQINFVLEESANMSDSERVKLKKAHTDRQFKEKKKFGSRGKFAPKGKSKFFDKKSSPNDKKTSSSDKTFSRDKTKSSYSAKASKPDVSAKPSKEFGKKMAATAKSYRTYAPVTDPPAKTPAAPSGPYVVKPKYSSLLDYLDQRKKKGSHEEKSEQKPSARSSEDRQNSEKRSTSENNRGGFRKARPEKSGRKNKSR